ncbi:ATP synthase mitochondrial F1 complex assembly factor 2 [Grifola frondosa]|uniref:ATP synthase mitochondrial F1 complex assembly factor 2 n=1 Tax=Grifola frondosa TaxID=5627 RepID=A0A1C7MGF8_GRIFR|nr:ATP synthase mitochondrial F1 complex assembly factor 2 [Grifola frondosa]
MYAARAVLPLLRSTCRPALVHRRLWNVRTLATVPESGPAVTATNRAEATLKRFWKTVGIEQPSINTPAQETLLKPHALPMTSLASRAIDAFGEEKTHKEVRAQLLQYLETDTICYHADEPAALVSLQEKHWKPLLDWSRSTFDIEINVSDSFLFSSQPPDTLRKLDEVMSKFDQWEMAAMERSTYTSKSLLIALALVKRQITVEQAALAAHVEVNSQIARWGEVEDTHDVDFHDIRRQLGSASCLLSNL